MLERPRRSFAGGRDGNGGLEKDESSGKYREGEDGEDVERAVRELLLSILCTSYLRSTYLPFLRP